MPSLVKAYQDFRGGWNADVAPDNLQDNELMTAENVDLGERGAISKRKGTVPFNATSYGAQVEELIEWGRKDGSYILLAVIGTKVCRIADDGTKTDLKTLDNAEVGYFFYADKFYFTGKESGTVKYWVYDGTAVTEVEANAAEDNDLEPIKRCRKFVWHTASQRIFAARDPNEPTVLYYSSAGDPTYFPATNKLVPSTGDGPIRALDVFGDSMVTIFGHTAWAYQGVDPSTDATWRKLALEQGTQASKSVVLTPETLTFLGQGGLFSVGLGLLDSTMVVLLDGNSLVNNQAKNRVTSVLQTFVHPETCAGVFDRVNERYMLAFGDDSGNPRNTKILVLDWDLKTFTLYTGLQVNCFIQRSNGDLMAGSNGYILRFGQGNKDFDVATGDYKAIQFHVATKQWNLDYPVHQKKAKRVFLAGKQYDVENTTVDIKINSGYNSLSYPEVSLDESFVWGEEWGSVWGWSDLVRKVMKCGIKGERFQMEITDSNLDDAVTIYGIAWEFKVRKPQGVKVT